MKPPRPRLLASTKGSVVISWSNQPTLSSSGSSSSLLQRNRQSRSSLSSDDRKVSRTSLASTDTSLARKSLRTPMESIEDALDSPADTVCQTKEYYTLQRQQRLLGWTTAYWGYKNQFEVLPLAPGEVYQFRVKATSEEEESDWSDVLMAATKDDVVSAASLHRALDQGHATSARKVLALRISALEVPSRLGRTPLAVATVRGDTAVASMLLTCGADVTARETGSLRTPLMAAASRGSNELIHVLKERDASWVARDRFGQTTLHYSVMNAQLATVQVAMKETADVNVKDNYGWTPLMLAVTAEAPMPVLEWLLSHGADVNSADQRGHTALMQAIVVACPGAATLLLDKGARVAAENCNGHTAYDIAKHSAHKGVLDLLPFLECKKETARDHIPKRRKQSQAICAPQGQPLSIKRP